MRVASILSLVSASVLALATTVAAPAPAQPASVPYLLDDSPAAPPPGGIVPVWGRLANPGFTNRAIKAALFFTGQARDGTNKYDCTPAPGDNRGLYTMHPLDGAHLAWSDSTANRDLALAEMARAGINVINLSSWGEDFAPCAWVDGAAPMQSAPRAHDELFAAAAGTPLLIAPYLESRGGAAPWHFRGEFPTRPDGAVAPGTVSQIVNFIHRYLDNRQHPEWADRWARVYDQAGEERYAVVIIHAASDRIGGDNHLAFARGFDAVADEVFRLTGRKVGFFIDALPRGTDAPGQFKPAPEATGSALWRARSMLGIQCFVPEIWIGSSDTAAVIAWKRDFSRRWFASGIPFLMDVSPGYDGHIVFPGAPRYGLTPAWISALSDMATDYGAAGTTFNAWNGYTESLAAMPTQQHGGLFYTWLQSLPGGGRNVDPAAVTYYLDP
jgi:hypothetical protein